MPNREEHAGTRQPPSENQKEKQQGSDRGRRETEKQHWYRHFTNLVRKEAVNLDKQRSSCRKLPPGCPAVCSWLHPEANQKTHLQTPQTGSDCYSQSQKRRIWEGEGDSKYVIQQVSQSAPCSKTPRCHLTPPHTPLIIISHLRVACVYRLSISPFSPPPSPPLSLMPG